MSTALKIIIDKVAEKNVVYQHPVAGITFSMASALSSLPNCSNSNLPDVVVLS